MSANNGGPAFPNVGDVRYTSEDQYGMTLRDYFAAKALAVLARTPYTAVDAAETAYRIADAMLKARKS